MPQDVPARAITAKSRLSPSVRHVIPLSTVDSQSAPRASL